MQEQFMQAAVEEAKIAYSMGEIPVGAVIVRDGCIIGRGHNCAECSNDPTCHAEIMAIRDACRKLGAWRLTGCEMYVTLEPCSMCAGAIVLARIEKLHIGTLDPKSGACVSLNNITTDERLNHQVKLDVGLLSEDCSGLLKDFFRSLRSKAKKTEEKQ